jgi:predicted CXXCH cytochrome family protein
MKTALITALILATTTNAFAVCEFSTMMDENVEERMTFSMKVNRLTAREPGISFEQREQQLDEISAGCMSCHDGTLGAGGAVSLHGNNSAIRGSHSIGVDYNHISYRRSDYRNIHNISAAVKFVEGRLGCLSCHDLQSKQKHHLVAPMDGSKLCFECHAK